MKKIIIACSFFCAVNIAGYCGQVSKIELVDGSVINGEIVSYLNGVYTVNTASVGEVKVAGDKVAKIEAAKYASSGTLTTDLVVKADDPASSQVSAYGKKLMKNPENVAVIKNVIGDPKLQEIAQDPQLQEAAQKGDIQALLKNPKFMEMVNSQEMQEAVKKLKK
ncbi:MAG TPA: hypothetical protein PL125_05320 [Candidatus Omnitrophota bacterium]|nr:hypothetical protein [Candidatus Omnitrophota bacterium]HPT39595.1 hypothetical protein [Candidatus Omnitrophota bacterium]